MRLLPIPGAGGIGECPVWDDRVGRLWWVDVERPALCRSDPEGGETTIWPMPDAIGSLALTEAGDLILSLQSGFHRFDPGTGALRFLAGYPREEQERVNDGKTSPEGRFFLGTMDREERRPRAALHRLDPGGGVWTVVEGLTVSNGLAWTPDGQGLWHSDSADGRIWLHRYDPDTGLPSDRRLVAQPDIDAVGLPDGGATDVEGGYWSAGVSAGRLNRWLADGTLDRSIAVPLRHPTMPCFGGPGLRTLFLTSLRDADAGPDDGRILVLDPGVAGVPVGRFAG